MKELLAPPTQIKSHPSNFNNYFPYNTNLFNTNKTKENFEKDSIIKKIISNADDDTDSVSNSEVSFNFSQTISDENLTHSMRISKQSFVDSILTLPSQTYRNNREEKSSERKDSARIFQMKSPPTSGIKEINSKRGIYTDRLSIENGNYNSKDPNATDSILYANNKGTKRELTERSIFYTPSTICNYYQHSYDVTPNKNITDSNNKISDRSPVHKFKLNLKNLNLININNSNNNCNTSNTNSNFYEENITENNENISSSSRLNVHTFEKRTPIKYIKSQMNYAENRSKGKDEKSLSNMNPFNLESSPSVVSNNFKKHLNISSIEIDDRSIDINEEMTKDNRSIYYQDANKNIFEKKNLISAFDQIKMDEINIKDTVDNITNNVMIVNNTNNINLNIIRNENFSFDMTNKAVSFNYNHNNVTNKINNYNNYNNNYNDNFYNEQVAKVDSKENHNSNIKVNEQHTQKKISYNMPNLKRNEYGSHSVKNTKATNSKFDYNLISVKSNKNQTSIGNKKTTSTIKSLKDTTKQYYSLKTVFKTNTPDNLKSTAIQSSNKSQRSSLYKFKEVSAFDEVSDYDSNKNNNNKGKDKSLNLNLSKVNITNNFVKQPKAYCNKTNLFYTEPAHKRTEKSKSPSPFNHKGLAALSKPIASPFDNSNKHRQFNNNKYKPASLTVKTKNNINSVDSKKIKDKSDINKSIITPASINNTNLPYTSTVIKRIINENITKKFLNKTNHNHKKIQELKEVKNSERSFDNQIRLTTNESKITVIEDNNKSRYTYDKTAILNDELKNVITNFSHYKKSNKDYCEYIPKKVIMKDACLQTSPCKFSEDDKITNNYFNRKEINDKKFDKLDLKLNKEIVFSKLNNIKGDDDIDLLDDYE